MNGLLDPKSYAHVLKVATGPYPSAELVPTPMMDLQEAMYAAQAFWSTCGSKTVNERLRAYFADCVDVLAECSQ